MKPIRLRFQGIGSSFTGRAVTIDFSKLDPGVYAFAGPNGAGKSTIMELMYPGAIHRKLASYGGESVISHVPAETRNAYLEYEFQLGVERHRILLQMDARGRGKTEAYYQVWDGGGNRWMAMAGPHLREFDAFAKEYHPTWPAMLAGPFAAQQSGDNPGGDFFALSKADRKSLFVEWLGIGEDLVIGKEAKDKAVVLQRELDAVRDKIGEFDAVAARMADLDLEIEALQVEVDHATADSHDAASLISDVDERRQSLETLVAEAKEEAEKSIAAEKMRCHEHIQTATVALGEASARVADEERIYQAARDDYMAYLRAVDAATRAEESMAGVDLNLDVCRACPLTVDAQVAMEAPVVVNKPDRDEIESVQAFQQECREEIQSWKVKLAGLVPEIDQESLDALDEARAVLIEGQAAQRRADRILFDCERKMAALNAERGVLAGGSDIEALRSREAELVREVDAYGLIAQAYSGDGVPAVKIAQAGPGISATANKLLRDCYGPRFQIRLTTLAPKKTGGTKETFDCEILDAQTGNTPHRGSPGQMVVLSEALRMAISIDVMRRSGLDCRSIWRDEAAGALDQWGDENNAMRYLDMLKAGRKAGGFDYVFFVAHQPAVWQAADGVFVVQDGSVDFYSDPQDVKF